MHDLTQFHTVLDTLYRACFIDTSHFLLILHRANSFSKQWQARTLYIVSGRVTSTALHRLSIIPLGMMHGRLEAIPREVEISEFFFFSITNTDKNYTHLCRPLSNAANNANVIIFFCLDSILSVNLPRMLHVK